MVAAFSYIIKKCVPSHPSRYSLDTFSRLGEGFYRYALCKKLGCSWQLPHATTPDSCIQLCPRGTPMQSARAGEARPRGKAGNERRKACFRPGGSGFHLPRGHISVPPPVLFKQLLRHKQVLCFFPCTPRASALRQARVSGGNLQNCAPSAACGGAMTQERNVTLRPFPVFPAYAISSISYSRVPMPSFSPCSRPACQLVSGNSAVK